MQREIIDFAPDTAGATPNARQAALVLHGMTSADRQWALDQLPMAQRERLEGLLLELHDLGIPQDTNVLAPFAIPSSPVSEAPEEPFMGAPSAQAHSLEHLYHALQRSTGQQLFVVLREEPPMVLARLLQVTAWQWEDDVLRRLDAALRAKVQALRASLEHTPRGTQLEKVLVEGVWQRCVSNMHSLPLRGPLYGTSTAASDFMPAWLRALLPRRTSKAGA